MRRMAGWLAEIEMQTASQLISRLPNAQVGTGLQSVGYQLYKCTVFCDMFAACLRPRPRSKPRLFFFGCFGVLFSIRSVLPRDNFSVPFRFRVCPSSAQQDELTNPLCHAPPKTSLATLIKHNHHQRQRHQQPRWWVGRGGPACTVVLFCKAEPASTLCTIWAFSIVAFLLCADKLLHLTGAWCAGCGV